MARSWLDPKTNAKVKPRPINVVDCDQPHPHLIWDCGGWPGAPVRCEHIVGHRGKHRATTGPAVAPRVMSERPQRGVDAELVHEW